MRKYKTITSADIMALQKGEEVEWVCATPRAARNAQSLVNYVKNFCTMAQGVSNYQTQRIGQTIKIKAL